MSWKNTFLKILRRRKEGEGASQRTCLNDPRTWTTVWGLTVGAGGGLGGGGERG